MAKRFTLGKEERLKSRKLIDELFSKGKTFNLPPFRVVYLPAETGLRSGVGVSTRNFKKAVDRNRIKRLVREAYRLQKNPLQEMLKAQHKGLILFINYTSREMPEYPIVFEGIQKCLSRLGKSFHEKGTADT